MTATLHLNLVTALIRVGNIATLAQSIETAPRPGGVSVHWWVVIDDRFDIDVQRALDEVGRIPWATAMPAAGRDVWNAALDSIESGWIYFLDDDNLLHPALPARLAEIVREHPSAGAVLFHQDLGDGSARRVSRDNVRIGEIDIGQLAVSREFVGELRFDLYAPSSDGLFIETLYRRGRRRFVFLPEVLGFYNAQTVGRFGEVPVRRLTPGPLPQAHNAGSLVLHRTFPEETARRIKLSSRGDRLFLDAGEVLRSTIRPGRVHLSGRAWIEGASGSATLVIKLGDVTVRETLKPPVIQRSRLLRRVLRRSVTLSADATVNDEVEIAFSGPGGATLVIDALRIAPR